MKLNRLHSLCVGCLVLIPILARAQAYDLNWSTIDGGGGTCTAGVYTVTGTIGQPDAGRLNSSDFTIDGGFWSIVAAIQEPGAPKLSVRFTQTNTVVVSWPVTWPGFVLLENPDANTTNWVKVATQPVIVATGESTADKQVVVASPIGKRFYRLRKP